VSPERLRAALAAIASLPILAGCGYPDFLWQGAVGQLELISGARPVDDVLATTGDAKLAERLTRAREVRTFASRELALPDNATYRRYTDVGRPFVVWNVFAAPPLSLEPRRWCFPVAGCVNYRGYFREEDAKAEAARLAAGGDDVHIGGVPAYSTLGWFDDPLLSTFIRYPDTALARLVFHELAHQVVYVKDDTSFNEAFATAVEEEGLARWLAAQAGSPAHAALVAEAARGKRLRDGFREWMHEARSELASVYASTASDAQKRSRKAALAGDLSGARALNNRLLPLHLKLFVEPNPIPVKWALARMGRIGNGIRLPLVPLAEASRPVVEAALHEVGLL